MKILIDEKHVRCLYQHAQRDYPYECCGILLGRQVGSEARVNRIIQAGNITREDRKKTYQIDWKILFDTVRTAREGPDHILGFYHSHPDGSTHPSCLDQTLAWVDHSYVIISIRPGATPLITSWRIPREDNSFERELLYRNA